MRTTPRNSSATTSKKAASEHSRVQQRWRISSLPLFTSGGDPGPSFVDLLRRTRHPATTLPAGAADMVGTVGGRLGGLAPTPLPAVVHGTTIVALRYDNGVVVAGDRRATRVIDAVLRFKIVGIGRRPMLIQRRTDFDPALRNTVPSHLSFI